MKAVSSLLPGFLRQFARDEAAVYACLCEFWPRIVGEQLAAKTFPLRFGRKRLVLETPNDLWRAELEAMKEDLILWINKFWGIDLVEQINFKAHQSD
ncbi:MAG TPA: DUF721 domain-containing protein [Acidobacteriota bacterium]|jgi:predicted nucleic acid-binding Zn ribbon protein|nr:DUF721 domain-containing protein [Acidobacteriota bacterium]